jgi:serine/threonine protein kinase
MRSLFVDPSNLETGTKLCGFQADYTIVKRLGAGQRGNTYHARVSRARPQPGLAFSKVADGVDVVIKTVKLSEEWPVVEILDYLSRVNRSLQKELLVLAKLKGLPCAAQIYDYGHLATRIENYPVSPMFIVQSFVSGETLDKYALSRWGWGHEEKVFSGIPNRAEWFRLASLIATNLIAVHQREVVHRDIWPPNIMVKAGARNGPKLSFIDFGDAVLRHELAARDALAHGHAYKSPERTNDWLWPTRRADIYAVGGVLYYLATGNPPPMPIADKDEMKTRIVEEMKLRNQNLLAGNPGIADIIARCLRYDPTERIPDADHLLHEIETFQDVDRPRSNGHAVGLKTSLTKVEAQVRKLSPKKNNAVDLFAAMAAQDLSLLAHRLESMTNGVRDISGDHDEIVSGLTRYLSMLKPGDQYLAVTIPDFWSPQNLGINGRFLTMNRLIAERGVVIKRLFLVTQEEWDARSAPRGGAADRDPNHRVTLFRDVAAAHLKVRTQLPDPKQIDLRYLIVPEDMRTEFLKNDFHKGVWISGGSAVTILPVYKNKGRRIRTVRMRKYEGKAEVIQRELMRLIERGKVLEEV